MDFLRQNFNLLRDIADIAVVAIFLYYFLLLIRGTRAVQILQGLVVLLVFQAVFYQLKLQAAYFVLRGLVLSIVVALPIVFQPELRRALMQLGARSIVSPFQHVSRDVLVKIIDEIAWAASILSQTKYGALIVIERETGLEEFIETGVKVNGEVSSKLLLSIFIPRSPLHDGAAIVRGDKVVAASCYLPLSEVPPVYKERSYGTRHRAAIGLTEQTDAIVVVVSEETGYVSIAKNGLLHTNIDEETLKRTLLTLCAPASRPTPPAMVKAPAREMWNTMRSWVSTATAPPRPRAPVTRAISPDALPPEVAEPEHVTRELSAPLPEPSPIEMARDLGTREPSPEEAAEAQRLTQEAVQKRALEAQRRKAEEEALKAEEEARRAEEAGRGQQEPAAAPPGGDKPSADGPN